MQEFIKKEIKSLNELLGLQEDEYLESRILNVYALAKKHDIKAKLKKDYAPFLVKLISNTTEQILELEKRKREAGELVGAKDIITKHLTRPYVKRIKHLTEITGEWIGEEATPYILEELEESENTLKEKVFLNTLSKTKNKQAIDAICKYLSKQETRKKALKIIKNLETPYACEALCRNIKNIFENEKRKIYDKGDITKAVEILKEREGEIEFEKILLEELKKTENKGEIEKILTALTGFEASNLKLEPEHKKKMLYSLLDVLNFGKFLDFIRGKTKKEFSKAPDELWRRGDYTKELAKLLEEQGLMEIVNIDEDAWDIYIEIKPKKECAHLLKEYIKTVKFNGDPKDKEDPIIGEITDRLSDNEQLFFTLDELYEKKAAEEIIKKVLIKNPDTILNWQNMVTDKEHFKKVLKEHIQKKVKKQIYGLKISPFDISEGFAKESRKLSEKAVKEELSSLEEMIKKGRKGGLDLEKIEKEFYENKKIGTITSDFLKMEQTLPVKIMEMEAQERLRITKHLEHVTDKKVKKVIEYDVNVNHVSVTSKLLHGVISFAEKCTIPTDEIKKKYNKWLLEKEKELREKHKEELRNLKGKYF